MPLIKNIQQVIITGWPMGNTSRTSSKTKDMKIYTLPIIFLMICASGCAQSQSKADRKIAGGCEDCELMFEGMPATLSWSTTIAKAEEPGERMMISGTI